MSEKEKYIILIQGKLVEVTKEIYDVYYHHRRKEKYFMHDLKAGRRRMDKGTGEIVLLPSIEDSYDRLRDADLQFADNMNVEDEVIQKVMCEKLHAAIKKLSREEAELIWYIFFQQIGETELSRMYGVPRTTLQGRKNKILKKLKKFME